MEIQRIVVTSWLIKVLLHRIMEVEYAQSIGSKTHNCERTKGSHPHHQKRAELQKQLIEHAHSFKLTDSYNLNLTIFMSLTYKPCTSYNLGLLQFYIPYFGSVTRNKSMRGDGPFNKRI